MTTHFLDLEFPFCLLECVIVQIVFGSLGQLGIGRRVNSKEQPPLIDEVEESWWSTLLPKHSPVVHIYTVRACSSTSPEVSAKVYSSTMNSRLAGEGLGKLSYRLFLFCLLESVVVQIGSSVW